MKFNYYSSQVHMFLYSICNSAMVRALIIRKIAKAKIRYIARAVFGIVPQTTIYPQLDIFTNSS